MKSIASRLFPKSANGEYAGSKIAYWVFVLIAVVSMVRSCIHLFAPDGGAGSIAGIDLGHGGAASIVFAFGLWGLSQVIYAFFQLLAAFRYKNLIPLMYLVLIFETAGRMLVGLFKHPILLHSPPGGFADYVMLPLAAVMLVLSLIEPKRRGPDRENETGGIA